MCTGNGRSRPPSRASSPPTTLSRPGDSRSAARQRLGASDQADHDSEAAAADYGSRRSGLSVRVSREGFLS